MFSSSNLLGSDLVLAALAILESADQVRLAALLEHELSSDQIDLLRHHPHVGENNEIFSLEEEFAIETLKQFKHENLHLYCELHQQALDILEINLRAGETTIEKSFLAVLTRLADELIKDSPERFISLVESISNLPLTTPTVIQFRKYFQGLMLRKQSKNQEAIAVFTTLLNEADLDLRVWGRALNSRANCYRDGGKFEQALDDYEASMTIWRQLDKRVRIGLALLNMGIVDYELQNYGQAEERFQESIRFFKLEGATQWEASAYNELGLIHRDLGSWEVALEYFEKCRMARPTDDAPDVEGRRLNNVGEVLLFQGHLEKALTVFREALDKMTTPVYKIDVFLNQGLILQATEKFADALESFEQAKALALHIDRRNNLPYVLYRKGDLLRRLSDNAGALTEYLAAVRAVEEEWLPMQEQQLKISLLGKWQQVYEDLVLHFILQENSTEAFNWAEHSRARAFAEMLTMGSSEFLSEQNSPPDKNGEYSSVVSVNKIQTSLSEREAVCCYFTTGVLDRDVPLLSALSSTNPIREHLLTSPKTLLFFITKTDFECFDCEIDPNQFITNSPRGHHYEQFFERGVRQYLYSTLLGIAGNLQAYEHLYIIPHGPLHQVPFCALLEPQAEPFLRSGKPYVTYAPSATILINHFLKPRAFSPDAASLLAIGYRGDEGTARLHYAELEASTVANLMEGEAWVDSHPKKEQLPLAAANQQWLHFACHGWFNQNRPLESYLQTGTKEHLTAQEVIQRWQLSARLVALSACQTGVSRILRSDEPMGLVRAFLNAGAQAVLVSQWAVDDFSTILLIYYFYKELADHTDANLGKLLHDAQTWLSNLTAREARELLKEILANDIFPLSQDPLEKFPLDSLPFSHPRHWAAFILVGK